MNVYFSAPFSWRESLKPKRDELVDAGVTVVSSWIDGPDDEGDGAMTYAEIDLMELRACDVFVAFTLRDDQYRVQWGHDGKHRGIGSRECPRHEHHHHDNACVPPFTGGRHVEYGYALAMNKIVMRVGPRENIFYELAGYSTHSWQIASEVLQIWANHPETRPAPWTA